MNNINNIPGPRRQLAFFPYGQYGSIPGISSTSNDSSINFIVFCQVGPCQNTEIWIGNSNIGMTDQNGNLTVNINPGIYTYTAIKNGFYPKIETITILQGQKLNIPIILLPII